MTDRVSDEAASRFVVHVLHRLSVGGLENGVVNLINGLARDRFRHAVVCIEDYDDFANRIRRPDVQLFALHRSRVGVWRLRLSLLRLFRELRPDIVHTRNLSGLDALLPARLTGARTVHSEHGFEAGDPQGMALKPRLLRRLHAPLVQRFLAMSKDLQQVMVERWGAPAGAVDQIYNGVDAERFAPVGTSRHDRLPPHVAAENVVVIGAVGRADPVKDQATLLRALARAVELDPEVGGRLRFVLVGDGPELPGLLELADRLSMRERCWMPGRRADVAELMQAFDVFVLPSLNEGISNTLLEAMATGIPLLATAVGGNRELVDEAQVGALFEPRDHERLAQLILTYARDTALRRAHGAAARRRAVEHFSMPAMLAAYARLYQGV